MFFAFLSLTLFPGGVILYFLEKGHSHMAPDRTVGHCRQSLKGANHWIPEHFVSKISNVNNVFAEHLDYNGIIPCMFEGWDELFSAANFIRIPYLNQIQGYTKAHCFEFRKGLLSISMDHETQPVHVHAYIKDPSKESMYMSYTIEAALKAGQAVMTLLFQDGKTWDDATMEDVRIKSTLLNVYIFNF